MNYHNRAESLENLESLLFETLTKKQKEELMMLKEAKKTCDELDNKSTFTLVYYDKKGKRMSLWNWSSYNGDFSYKIINQHRYGDFFVSTVWLGMDHAFPYNPQHPVIFETMIFVEKEREHELNNYMERYCTEAEAIKGHLESCKLANKAASKDLTEKLSYFNKELKKK